MANSILGLSPTNACMQEYMDWNCWAAILDTKRSASVAKACKWGNPFGLWNPADTIFSLPSCCECPSWTYQILTKIEILQYLNLHLSFVNITVNRTFFFLLKIFFGGHQSFLWGHWYPCCGLLVTSALSANVLLYWHCCTLIYALLYPLYEINYGILILHQTGLKK